MKEDYERRIRKLEEDYKYEYANIRANYFLTIFIVLTYVILEINFEDNNVLFTVLGYNIDKMYLFVGISLGLLIFNYKNIYTYSKELIKRHIFKIKK